MSLMRFLMLLALVVWVGGIIFFAFVVAPTVFGVLPTHDLAGRVVSRSLTHLHWMGIVAGFVFLALSLIESYTTTGSARLMSARNLLILLMLALTLTSQLLVARKMLALRNDMGIIDNVPVSDARRIEFNQLHQWSTRLESGTLLGGLLTLYLLARQQSQR